MSNKYRECVDEALPTMRYRQCVDEALSTMMFGKQVEQRWSEKVSGFLTSNAQSRKPFKSALDRGDVRVDQIEKANASRFVTTNHYLSSYPQHTASYGLYLKAKLVGVAVYSNPARNSGKRYGNVPQSQVQELSRLVLLPSAKSGAETYFLAESLKRFKSYFRTAERTMAGSKREPRELSVLISHSDPMPVVNKVSQRVVLSGHIGNIYQARSMLYTGRSRIAYRYTTWDGKPIPARSLTKIRAYLRGDNVVGAGGKTALEDLGRRISRPLVRHIEAGFEDRSVEALLRDWARANPDIIQVNKHPGNLVYVKLTGGRRANRRIVPRLPAPTIEAWVFQKVSPDLHRLQRRNPKKINSYAACARKSLLFGVEGPFDFQPDPTTTDLGTVLLTDPQSVNEAGLNMERTEDSAWWLGQLEQARDKGNTQLWQDATWRGLVIFLRRTPGRLSSADILTYAKTHPYPKRPRQRYIKMLRDLNRDMCPGYLTRAGDKAHELLDVWETLTDKDRQGLPVPPQLYTETSCRVGSLSRHDSLMSVEQLLSEVYCG
tara:strand:+ start:5531 stop:7168 length:1638 start_codon:yes stop_codon:yes gene_type:complete